MGCKSCSTQPRIVAYKVLFDPPAALQRQVEEALAEGWQPLGGCTNNDSVVYQAMVKYETPLSGEW